METTTQNTQSSPTTAAPKPSRGTSPGWILAAVAIGFFMPVCACAVFFFGSVAALGSVDQTAFSDFDSTLETGPAVAIVRIEGTILHNDDPDEFLNGSGSARVIDDLRMAEADDDVKAIVLRVDSPGGTVTGSAQIYEAIVNEVTKPVIVSMGGTAASGGYYVAAPADYIFARPDTLTGSLGVIFTLFNVEELINEYGVDVNNITSGPNKSIGSPWEELTPEQEEIFNSLVEESYDEFVRIIVEGRGLSDGAVRELADGRVYSGRQAAEVGLVDELGNFQDAIDEAADRGGITGEPRIIEYERLPTFEQFLTGVSTNLNQSEVDRMMSDIYSLTTPSLEYRYRGQ